MCTSDCKCYAGQNDETKQKWISYGNARLFPFLRNVNDTNVVNNGKTTYPLKWSDTKAGSVSTFSQCYEEVLKPNLKYKNSYSAEEQRFFLGGGYEILKRLENEFVGCAGICEPPLFYLSQDISLGIPSFECIENAMIDSNKKS